MHHTTTATPEPESGTAAPRDGAAPGPGPGPAVDPGAGSVGRACSDLAGLLTLERIDRDLFRGWCHDGTPLRAYGGQVAAQALTAAGHTVPGGQVAHSLHGYFLRAGDTRRTIDYQVERLRDGRGYVSRRVTALQDGEAVFTLSASFKLPEDTDDRQVAMPDVPGPENLPNAFLAWADADPESHRRSGVTQALDVRLIPAPEAEKGGTEQRLWLRSYASLPDDPMLHMCALAYASDLLLAPVAALDRETPGPLAKGPGTTETFLTSLDHAVWFHRPFRADDWLLVVQRSPSAGDGRGIVHGEFWNRDGRLVASVVQETLLRHRKPG
ncbi:acyl-CoA thioesterase [Streptomyces sp. NPDC004609]|uniref:acyl-CoA thioesterase n=1 Tax=Streptomyces sp. NPDC004609 TaxID=3364704 RepID=UPI00369B6388